MNFNLDEERGGAIVKACDDILAGKHAIQKHRKEDIDQFSKQFPQFNKSNLSAIYSYSDGQMDDRNLGLMLAPFWSPKWSEN